MREALLRLGEVGLVQASPGRSTTVATLDLRAVRDARDVVAAMHRLAVVEAAAALTRQDLTEMRAANRRFRAALRSGDVDAALAADDELHAVPVRVAANAALSTVLAQYTPVVRRAERARFSTLAGRASAARHDDLVRLLAAGSAEDAAALSFDTFHSLDTDTDTDDNPGALTMPLSDFPRHPLTFGPSPIHRLDRLTAHLGGATVWAKREDCNSGLAYGGNKLRKLEYLVPEALALGADTLVSIGGYQSNHTRQVAAVAAHLGLRCVLVQEKWVDWPDSVNDRVGNIMLSRIMGAEVRLDPAGFDIGFRDSWKQAIADVEARGGTPYAIPAGASDHPLGGLGFAGWADEVARQEEALGVFFDTVVVCTVTGSTHAGMIAGFAASGAGASRHRHRRLRDPGEDARPGGADRAAYGGPHRPRTRPARRRDHRAGGLGRRPLRHPGRVDARGDAPDRPARGRHPRPRLRGQVDGRPHRPGGLGRDPPRQQRALRAPRRPAGAERLLRALPRHRPCPRAVSAGKVDLTPRRRSTSARSSIAARLLGSQVTQRRTRDPFVRRRHPGEERRPDAGGLLRRGDLLHLTDETTALARRHGESPRGSGDLVGELLAQVGEDVVEDAEPVRRLQGLEPDQRGALVDRRGAHLDC